VAGGVGGSGCLVVLESSASGGHFETSFSGYGWVLREIELLFFDFFIVVFFYYIAFFFFFFFFFS
jgi:hypothetical protein